MRVGTVGHGLQHVFKLQKFGGKLAFQGLGEYGLFGSAPFAGFFQHALHAGVGVLQIGGGVAFEGEHVVPIEDVVAGAVFAQIGVFHGADADAAGDLGGGGVVQFGVFLFHQGGGALYGFIEQFDQLHGVAAAGFEGLAVFAHHGAEADEFGFHVFR